MDNPYKAPDSEIRTLEPENFPELSYKRLVALRNHSHTIRTLSVLWGLGGLGLLALVISAMQSASLNIRGWLLLAVSIYALIQSIYTFKRSIGSRWSAIFLCIMMMFTFPLGILFGLLGLYSLFSGAKLFGKGAIPHKLLEQEYKYRKKNKIRN